jgi:hypothetical protein
VEVRVVGTQLASNSAAGTLKSVFGKINNLPNTLIGLAVIGVDILCDACPPPRFSIGNNAIQAENIKILPASRISGITLGNVILYPNILDPNDPFDAATQAHERQHTYQGEVLGPLYLDLHVGFGLFSIATTPGEWDWWKNNPLEWGPNSTPPVPFTRRRRH